MMNSRTHSNEWSEGEGMDKMSGGVEGLEDASSDERIGRTLQKRRIRLPVDIDEIYGECWQIPNTSTPNIGMDYNTGILEGVLTRTDMFPIVTRCTKRLQRDVELNKYGATTLSTVVTSNNSSIDSLPTESQQEIYWKYIINGDKGNSQSKNDEKLRNNSKECWISKVSEGIPALIGQRFGQAHTNEGLVNDYGVSQQQRDINISMETRDRAACKIGSAPKDSIIRRTDPNLVMKLHTNTSIHCGLSKDCQDANQFSTQILSENTQNSISTSVFESNVQAVSTPNDNHHIDKPTRDDIRKAILVKQKKPKIQPHNCVIETSAIQPTVMSDPQRRFRNFRFSLLKTDYLERREFLHSKFDENCKFVIGQEKKSIDGQENIELFMTTKNQTTWMSVKNNFNLNYGKGVAIGDIQQEINCVCKADTYVAGGIRINIGKRKEAKNDIFWFKFLESSTISQGMALVESEKPLDYIRMHGKLQSILVQKIGLPNKSKFTANWKIPFVEWEQEKPRTRVFIGPSGIGKTNFALAHFKNSLHVTIRQDFDKLGPDKYQYDGIVVDDLPLHKWDAEEIIALTDTSNPTAINVKYATGVIPVNAKIIIRGNSLRDIFNDNWNAERIVAIKRRCEFHIFDNTVLFDAPEYSEEDRKARVFYYNNNNKSDLRRQFDE